MIVASPAIDAVIVDLDDTLFPQSDWLEEAWEAVADAATAYGLAPQLLLKALHDIARHGSDRGHIIDRALAMVGGADVPVGPLVKAFHQCRPSKLRPYPGVLEALVQLRRQTHLGLITDGEPKVQQAKLDALDLSYLFEVIVFSDSIGRGYRKPHPAPFQAALSGLGVVAEAAVYVGDRPDKDVAGALASGLRVIRVRTGEYADQPDLPETWLSVDNFADVVSLLAGHLRHPDGSC